MISESCNYSMKERKLYFSPIIICVIVLILFVACRNIINMNRNKITIEAENIINSLKLDNKQIITGISKIDNK